MRKQRRSSLRFATLLAAAACGAPGPAAAAARNRHPAPAVPAAEAARTEAARAEENRLAAARVAAAARLRDVEARVAERAAAVSALAERRDEAEARLAEHARSLGPLLPLVQRLALFPAETLLATPGDPEDALRGLAVLRGLTRQLAAEAEALRRERDAVAAQGEAVQRALPSLREAEAARAAEGRALDAALAEARTRRETAEAAGLEAARKAAAEAAKAESLRAALAAAEAARARAEAEARQEAARAERRREAAEAAVARQKQAALAPAPDPAPEPEGGGGLRRPVAGRVSRPWGAPGDGGPATGITLSPAPGARVVAPCGGRVRFAGPFRSYGSLLILDCGGGTALVLAGLGRLDVQPGAAVLPGEPVGAMADYDPSRPGPRPALYLELRRGGQPVDPAPFLRGGA